MVELGAPQAVYDAPHSRFVAEFVGAANLIALHSVRHENGSITAETAWGTMRIDGLEVGAINQILVRPADIELATCDGENTWPATIVDVAFLGEYSRVRIRLWDTDLVAHLSRRVACAPGDLVRVHIAADRCRPVA